MVSRYPGSIEKATLGHITEMSSDSGTFRNYLSKLRTMGLIEYDGAGGILAAADLFT